MTKKLGHPSESSGGALGVEDALERLVQIQQHAFTLFVDRRVERNPGEPTRIQTFVLRTVAERGPISVSELAKTLNVSAPTASQLLQSLVERGWLQVDISLKDRRRRDIHITDDGRGVLSQRLQKRLRRVQRVLEQLTPEERTLLVTMLDRVVGLWQSTD